MEYICNRCGNYFEKPKELKNMGGDVGESIYVCPHCKSEDYEEAIECAVCGDVARESYSTECVCEKCMKKYAGRKHAFKLGEENYQFVRINGFIAEFYDDKDIESILIADMRKHHFDDQIEERGVRYCENDPFEFARYLKRKGVYEA